MSNRFYCGQAKSITHEYVFVALVIQHAKRMCQILSSRVSSTNLQYFSTLSHEPHDFRKKVIKLKLCILIFSTATAETIFIFKRIQRDTLINVQRSSCKVHAVIVGF